MRRRRSDANHKDAMGWFRALGCPVKDTHAVPSFVDFLALVGRTVLMIEVKDGAKPPSARKLTPAQETLHAVWPVHVVSKEAEARLLVSLTRVAEARTPSRLSPSLASDLGALLRTPE